MDVGGEKVPYNKLSGIERVFSLSDLHVDHKVNLAWLEEKAKELTDGDLLVVAGDISHVMARLRNTFSILRSTGCKVFYVPGNHEAWLSSRETGPQDSFVKLDKIDALCREMGVLIDATLLQGKTGPLWIAPLRSWYDGSLSLVECEDLCDDFYWWPWGDFMECDWGPDHSFMEGTNGRIPRGVADVFHKMNQPTLRLLRQHKEKKHGGKVHVMTVSHFLPNRQSLPDWKDLSSTEFLHKEWLNHGAPGTSAKFAKVAGSFGLDNQIRSIPSTMHVFGHSHRPKDFVLDGIRYVHNPLGYGRERDMYMVSPEVDFQLLWDSRGQVPGNQVMRLWEEQGGGITALVKRIEKRNALRKAKRQW